MNADNPTPAELARYIAYCIANDPRSFGVVRLRNIVVETKRISKKRPTSEATILVNEDVVRTLRGDARKGPEILMVVIPRDVCDRHEDQERRRESGIVLPNEVSQVR